ncbi:transcriptional regulator [Clostridium thermosuccinogenes]|uniref:Transcriptional regulator n=1 Tax=Clostridium thermosuccinogenes TaxID=84032 RepID=A0A2K2FLF6_9CLOT|nr:sugar diacid recognition domain-containing protein [Pseudoclostridium thermosuccinogenes]AUS96983.1 transcriptional regulator [Pseudoclostridium thermosuccinogenes]PNT99600.1 transcriptional regulator [Pseudoclostridium thermosuccinogenes]PNU01266.1 transcriptional regulator [Pseudoclostridium thermosuccinogenes]
MHLSTESAQQIANEISTIVKQNVNIMDAQGYIIASTDPQRIGNFHEGAKKIIEEGLPEFYVTPEAQTPTTRTGLNLPIVINGETIGVVGITGEYEQVYNYGQIVKKMTEILVRESYNREQERFDNKIRNRFLEDWILGSGLEQGSAFIERGVALHIDITRPRRAMVLRINGFRQLAGTGEGQKLIEKVEREVQRFISQEQSNIYLRLTTKQVCLVSPRSDEMMKALAEKLVQHIKRNLDVDLLIGIDSGESGTTDVRTAYAKANKASHACLVSNHSILLYDQINMEIFMEDIPKSVKEEYLRKIFTGCSYEKILHWINILEAYFSAEGSISLAAQKLYMHKNTLQYKLKKLEEITGYDVRLPSNSAVFYIAVLFFRDVKNDMTIYGE